MIIIFFIPSTGSIIKEVHTTKKAPRKGMPFCIYCYMINLIEPEQELLPEFLLLPEH